MARRTPDLDRELRLKTRHPLILTARVADKDIEPLDRLRQAHFPPDRNVLRAHLTVFHRLPGEHSEKIVERLERVADGHHLVSAEVSALRHLGAGVAYSVASPPLQQIHARLRAEFVAWLGPQDMQKWQPHITIQNKVSKPRADALYGDLSHNFQAHPIEILGLDLWDYLGGPWRHSQFVPFRETDQAGGGDTVKRGNGLTP
jgi:2'-5' RNA ligase